MVPMSWCSPLVVEPGIRPLERLPGTQGAAPLLDQQTEQPPRDVTVKGTKLLGCVPGTEVVAPSPQEQVQTRDQVLQLHTDPTQQGRGPGMSLLGLFRGPADHHEVIRVTDQLPGALLGPRPIERMQ